MDPNKREWATNTSTILIKKSQISYKRRGMKYRMTGEDHSYLVELVKFISCPRILSWISFSGRSNLLKFTKTLPVYQNCWLSFWHLNSKNLVSSALLVGLTPFFHQTSLGQYKTNAENLRIRKWKLFVYQHFQICLFFWPTLYIDFWEKTDRGLLRYTVLN